MFGGLICISFYGSCRIQGKTRRSGAEWLPKLSSIAAVVAVQSPAAHEARKLFKVNKMPSVIGKAGPPADLRRFMEKRLDGTQLFFFGPLRVS